MQIYVLVDSFYLVANAFTGGMLDFNMNDGVGAFLSSFFSSQSGGIVLIALVSTYGIYAFASFLYADPWHIFTSSWAYFVTMTTSINILMVYAFCNWHDVSWGTKGSDKAEALPSAQTKKDDGEKNNFIEELDKPQADIDSQFESTVKRALAPFVEPEEDTTPSLDDSFRNFRTALVLLWVFSNLIMSLLITSTSVSRMCLTVSRSLPPGRRGMMANLEIEHLHRANGHVLPDHPVGNGGSVVLPVLRIAVLPGQIGRQVLRQPTLKCVLFLSLFLICMYMGWECIGRQKEPRQLIRRMIPNLMICFCDCD